MSDKIEILKNKIKQKVTSFFNEYEILDYSEFKNDHSKMHIRHIKCGTIFKMDPHTLKRYGRGEFTKKSIKKKFPSIYDEKLTEFEMMDKTNLLRVWDCGNLFYRMKI